jgi:hypothetical protein
LWPWNYDTRFGRDSTRFLEIGDMSGEPRGMGQRGDRSSEKKMGGKKDGSL